jgi:hypothetical protein
MIVAGILSPIERPLTWLLETLHATFGLPWAWAVIALTLIVRILLVPISVKQIHSMQRLQRYAPALKELQKKYKNDKQKLREEQMKFFQEHQVNPALLRPARLRRGDLSRVPGVGPRLARHRPGHHGQYLRPLVRLPADRGLRGQPGVLGVLHVDDRGPDAANPVPGAAVRPSPVHHRSAWRDRLPGRPPPVLGDDEPVDGRPGTGDAAACPAHHTANDETVVADAAA